MARPMLRQHRAPALLDSRPCQGVISPSLDPKTLSVLIGGQYTRGATIPWHVRYDDIEIVTTP